MKWASHIAIGKAIADGLGLSQGERKAFLDGIVEPDRHKERGNGPRGSYLLSHHDARYRVIMLHVWMARKALLRNDTYQGYRHLGMALHYIQDRSTSKGFLGMGHDRREGRIASIEPSPIIVRKGMREHISSPEFIHRSLSAVRPLKDPRTVLDRASYISASVAAAVADLGEVSKFDNEFERARRKHSFVYLPLTIAALSIGLSLSLFWHSPYPAVPAGIVVIGSLMVDHPYRRLRRLAEWNGRGRH